MSTSLGMFSLTTQWFDLYKLYYRLLHSQAMERLRVHSNIILFPRTNRQQGCKNSRNSPSNQATLLIQLLNRVYLCQMLYVSSIIQIREQSSNGWADSKVHTGSDSVESFSMNWTQQYANYTHTQCSTNYKHSHMLSSQWMNNCYDEAGKKWTRGSFQLHCWTRKNIVIPLVTFTE